MKTRPQVVGFHYVMFDKAYTAPFLILIYGRCTLHQLERNPYGIGKEKRERANICTSLELELGNVFPILCGTNGRNSYHIIHRCSETLDV